MTSEENRIKRVPSDLGTLEERLLTVLSSCTWQLETDYGYYHRDPQQSGYYVDPMGAVRRPEHGTELANIMYTFLMFLIEHKKLPDPFDCVLANKDGNADLAVMACDYFPESERLPVIKCKGRGDKSRIQNDDPERDAHPLDFEGFKGFLDEGRKPKCGDGLYRAIIIDDNCAGGGSVLDLFKRFRKLQRDPFRLPLASVGVVVTLFNIVDPKTKQDFEREAVLYTLLVLNEEDKRDLCQGLGPELLTRKARLVEGFGTDWRDTKWVAPLQVAADDQGYGKGEEG